MFKSKDFKFMDVVSIEGIKIGFITDLLIDFNKGNVIGFEVSSNNILRKRVNILFDDIIYFNNHMVIKKAVTDKYLCLRSLISMDIIDNCKNVLGVVEDIKFTGNTFEIKGVIVSSGFITNLIRGKRIMLINELLLGEENILYYSGNLKYCLKSFPHNFFKEGKANENS